MACIESIGIWDLVIGISNRILVCEQKQGTILSFSSDTKISWASLLLGCGVGAPISILVSYETVWWYWSCEKSHRLGKCKDDDRSKRSRNTADMLDFIWVRSSLQGFKIIKGKGKRRHCNLFWKATQCYITSFLVKIIIMKLRLCVCNSSKIHIGAHLVNCSFRKKRKKWSQH